MSSTHPRAENEGLMTLRALCNQMIGSVIPLRIPESCSKFKSHNPSGQRIWQSEKKATIALKGQFDDSPVIGVNAVYVRPASWRSSTVLSSSIRIGPYVGKTARKFGVAARPESHLGNRRPLRKPGSLIFVCHQHVDAILEL
jgi:hypothetical protein